MGDEWVEVCPAWRPRTEGSRLLAKGRLNQDLKEGEKLLIMRNEFAMDDNKQPAFRIMIIRETHGEQSICLKCGEALSYDDLQEGNSYHDPCHRELREMAIDEKEVNPHGMG